MASWDVYLPQVSADAPAMRSLTPFPIPGRSPCLPPLYLYNGNHPNRQCHPETHRTFIYFVENTAQWRTNFDSMSCAQDVPVGPIGTRPTQNPGLCGIQELKYDDWVFARDAQGDGDPNNDSLKSFLPTVSDLINERLAVLETREKLLGRREERTPDAIWFERQERAKQVQEDKRCYGLSNMVQKPKQSEAPPASMKTVGNELDETQKVVRETLKNIAEYNIKCWNKHTPQRFVHDLQKYARLINAPSIGCKSNYMWYSFQLNVARPQHISKEESLAKQMGHFGGSHTDGHDCRLSLSCATTLSDIPDGWEPGRLHLLGLGMFVSLNLGDQFFFSGLLQHGGTSPLAPDNEEIPDWAYRTLIIAYPPTSFVIGNVRHAFAALPSSRDLFHITPEMTGAPHVPQPDGIWSSHGNFANDGNIVMDDESLVRFYVRALLQSNLFFLRQLPSNLGITIDREQFLRSITMTINDEPQAVAAEWPEGPSGNVQSSYDDSHQAIVERVLQDLHDNMSLGIPSAPDENPFQAVDITQPDGMGRPAGYKKAKGKRKQVGGDDVPSNKRTRRHNFQEVLNHQVRETAGSAWAVVEQSMNWLPMNNNPDPSVHDHEEDNHSTSEYHVSSASSAYKPLESPSRRRLARSSRRRLATSSRQPLASSSHQPLASSSQQPLRRSRRQIAKGRSLPRRSQVSSRTDKNRLTRSNVRNLSTALGTGLEDPLEDMSVLTDLQQDGNNSDLSCLTSLPEDYDDEDEEDDIQVPEGTWYSRIRQHALVQYRVEAYRQLEIVQDVSDNLHATTPDAIREALVQLDTIDCSPTPTSLGISNLPSYSFSMAVVRHHCNGTDTWTNLYRQRIMLSEHDIAIAIRDICESVPSILQTTQTVNDSMTWFEKLVVHVYCQIKGGFPIIANSAQFITTMNSKPCVFKDTSKEFRARKKLSTSEHVLDTQHYIACILQYWFNMPIPYISQLRVRFITLLLNTFGTGALLLPCTWAAYDSLPRWIFNEGVPTVANVPLCQDEPFLDRHLSNLQAELEQLSYANEVAESLHILQEKHLKLHKNVSQFVKDWIDARTGSRRIHHLLSGSQPSKPADKTTGKKSKQLRRAKHKGSKKVVATIVSSPGYGPTERVVELLRDSQLVLLSDADAQLTPAQIMIKSRSDFYMPLREKATSRAIVNDLMDLDFTQTRPGLFSLLVFRNIFFHSGAFEEVPDNLRKIWFHTEQEWDDYHALLKAHFPSKPAKFFCNKNAYGQHLRSRGVETAHGFWELSQSCEWPPGKLEFPVPFNVAWTWISKTKSSNHTKLPDFGPLGMYLLIADMHAAGLVQLPTFDDMGIVLPVLDAGGITGLQTLLYLSNSYNKVEVGPAFQKFFEDVSSQLTATELVDFSWNSITAEHTLCKFGRMFRLGHYK